MNNRGLLLFVAIAAVAAGFFLLTGRKNSSGIKTGEETDAGKKTHSTTKTRKRRRVHQTRPKTALEKKTRRRPKRVVVRPKKTQAHGSPKEEILARIGDLAITKKQLELWTRIERLRGGGNVTKQDVLLGLLERTIKASVAARSFGISPSTESLDKRAKALMKGRSGRTLARIAALFGKNRQEFLETFIRPIEIGFAMWKRFSRDKEVHRDAYAAARSGMEKLSAKPTAFASLDPKGGKMERNLVSLGTQKNPFPKKHPFRPLRRLPIDKVILHGLRKGELYPHVVETPRSLRILRVVGKKGGYVEVEVWNIPKKNYYSWISKKAAGMSPILSDETMKEVVNGLDKKSWMRRVFSR